jgi:hypothetical protein
MPGTVLPTQSPAPLLSPLDVPMFAPRWTAADPGGAAARPPADQMLLLLPSTPLGDAIAEHLGGAPRILREGDAVADLLPGPRHVVYAWGLDDPDGHTAFDRLHAVAAALCAVDGPLRLTVVTALARAAGGAAVRPAAATLAGPAWSLALERPDTAVSLVDVDPGEGPDAVAAAVAAELTVNAGGPGAYVAWRAGRRLGLSYEPVPHEPAPGLAPFRAGGTYLVTGGTGGIGGAIAAQVAAIPDARVYLLSRRPPQEPDPRFVYLAADVSDATAVRAAIGRLRADTGRLDGVVHAAGVVDDVPLARPDRGRIAQTLAPKLDGTPIVDGLCPDAGFVALCSSVTTVSGAYGHSAYVAANSYLDAYAAAHSRPERPVVSIAWTLWAGLGMGGAAEPPVPAQGVRGWLRPAEGVELLRRVLVRPPGPQVVVCPDGIETQLARASARAAAARAAAAEPAKER